MFEMLSSFVSILNMFDVKGRLLFIVLYMASRVNTECRQFAGLPEQIFLLTLFCITLILTSNISLIDLIICCVYVVYI